MAQKRVVTLVDDIDGSEATNSHTLTLDGVTVKIDLNDEHSSELHDAFRIYLDKGERQSAARSGQRAAARPRRASDSGDVRAWARENGYEVSERGRISAEVRAAYEARAAR